MLADDFIAGRICINVDVDDPISDVNIADDIIAKAFGAPLGFGREPIPEFIQRKREHEPGKNIQFSYNYFGDGNLGWMTDDEEWYPNHGVDNVPLSDFISEAALPDVDYQDFDDVIAM